MNVKISTIFVVLFLFSCAFSAELKFDDAKDLKLNRTQSSISLEFDLSGFSDAIAFGENDNTALVDPGQGILLAPGKPILPALHKFIIVPPDKGLEMQVTTGQARRIHTDAEPVLFETAEAADMQPFADEENDGLFPPITAKMSDPVVIRGVRVVKITTYPVQYDAENNDYIFHGHISTNVRFTEDEPVNPVRNPVRRNRSREFLKYIDALTVNGDQIRRDDLDDVQAHVGHYLVVTHESCLEYAAPFIEWRRKSGYKVDILSFNQNDAMNPNTVKNEIQDLYDFYLDEGMDPFDQILLIGDREVYDNFGNGNWILSSFRGNPIWGPTNHADYEFACLEGNDNFPEAGFARLPTGSIDLMELAVNRTLAYEAEPYMEETEWFTMGAVYSQHWGLNVNSAWHVSINTNVRWGNQVLRRRGFDDIAFFEDFDYDRNGVRIGEWFTDIFNEGRNVLIGRAQLWNWQHNFNGVNNNVVFPINITTNGIGDWAGNHMFRTGDGNNLKGPVALTFSYGDTPTIPMSCVWMEMVNGTLLKDLTFGWGRVLGITALERYVENFQYQGQWVYNHVKTDIEAFGDPGIQPWIGVPRIIETEIPEFATPQTRSLAIRVFDPENEEPVAGAQVTMYCPGDMPDFDDDAYAEYDEMIMETTTTGEDGIARVAFDEDVEFEAGTDLFITVTGRDILPHFDEIEIEIPDLAVDVGGYELSETEGNGDDIVNPGESFTIEIFALNTGDEEVVEDLRAVVSCASPWIEVEENEIEFGDIDPGEDALGEPAAAFNASVRCPDGLSRQITIPTILIEFTSGDRTWTSAVKLDPLAPKLTVREAGNDFSVPLGESELEIVLENTGRMDLPETDARLESLSRGIGLIEAETNYPEIEVNEQAGPAGENFQIITTIDAIPGASADLALILTTEAGFVDTAYFSVQMGNSAENEPHPPDKYGYCCFDDTDEEWEAAPDYEWIEINPDEENPDFDGEILDFEGESNMDIGEAVVVELGFAAQFYGEEFEEITVSSNGFVVFGDHELMVNFQNWPLDRGIGGLGMAAPFWDWLRFGDNSAIIAIHDEENFRFIVEWYRLRHIEGDDVDQTFQLIIKDPEVWQNETGDSDIIFQYQSVTNIRGPEDGRAPRERNNYYASAGISSPDGATGINYTFNDQYPVSSAVIEPERAILFTTQVRMERARVFGSVIDAENEQPIEGAALTTNYGFVAHTNADGVYSMPEAIAGMEFSLTARRRGYNDSTLTELIVREDEELRVDFALLHPEFTPTHDRLGAVLNVDEEIDLEFGVENTGNGTLDWRVRRELRGEANADPWEIRRQYNVGEVTDDSRIQGVVYANGLFYVAGANDHNPMIYIFNGEGELIDQFAQPGDDRYGFRDLAWDGEWIWGSGDDIIYALTPEGEVMRQFEGPYNPNNNAAWDPDREVLWASSTTSNISALDREGNVISELDRMDFRIYGLAYYPEDPDGYSLYIFHKNRDIAEQIIHKMNPENNDTMFVTTLEPPGGGSPIGAFITNQFDVYSYVFAAATNRASDDRLDLWQIEARKEWMAVEPAEGTIEAGDTQDFDVTLSSEDFPPVELAGDLVFTHNAAGGETRVELRLDIRNEGAAPQLRELNIRNGWSLISLNVTPEDNDIRAILQPLVEAGVLELLKDGEGRFYLPEHDFCNIPEWDVQDGYQIKLSEPFVWEVEGIPVNPDEALQLNEGWNLKSYYPREPVDAVTALSNIREELIIVKDWVGQFYQPQFNFCNMDWMVELQGYLINVREDVELIYNVEDNRGQLAVNNPPDLDPAEKRYSRVTPTGSNMSLLLNGAASLNGWEAAAFSPDGGIAGAGSFDASGRCGMAVWGDDPTTDKRDGLRRGESFAIKVWNGRHEFPAEVKLKSGELVYTADAFATGDLKVNAIPTEFAITGIYPNPFNAVTRLSFAIPEAGKTVVSIYDIAGRKTAGLIDGDLKAGYHAITWNAANIASGMYLARVGWNGKIKMAKVIVIK